MNWKLGKEKSDNRGDSLKKSENTSKAQLTLKVRVVNSIASGVAQEVAIYSPEPSRHLNCEVPRAIAQDANVKPKTGHQTYLSLSIWPPSRLKNNNRESLTAMRVV